MLFGSILQITWGRKSNQYKLIHKNGPIICNMLYLKFNFLLNFGMCIYFYRINDQFTQHNRELGDRKVVSIK